MSKYRDNLPQLTGGLFLTDSGLETFLYFQRGYELPEFAAFTLLDSETGRDEILAYMERHIRIALDAETGFVMETPTWRANSDWGKKLGYDAKLLAEANRTWVELMSELRDRYETPKTKMVISGNIGPRGDGYSPTELLTPDEARAYHSNQIDVFANSSADLVTALTITHVGEAVGITEAAREAGMPVVISFTTEIDGSIPEGKLLKDAIEEVDAITACGPAYYMVNCAHPTHFEDALKVGESWISRLKGIRANASTKSHEELDNSDWLDSGDPGELGGQYRSLLDRFPHFSVLGGCCGTDHRHIASISDACRVAA